MYNLYMCRCCLHIAHEHLIHRIIHCISLTYEQLKETKRIVLTNDVHMYNLYCNICSCLVELLACFIYSMTNIVPCVGPSNTKNHKIGSILREGIFCVVLSPIHKYIRVFNDVTRDN